ncbi:MAG TPA: hypothetical protein VJU61_12470 [Polyangiaceae bacterium]|nr:hypothetical protein [Polyangiaceae bacterium]
MTRELLGFFAPPRQLARTGLIAAGISGVLLCLKLPLLSLPALSLWFAWWLGGSFAHIAIQPISYWDRAWPVPQQLLLRTRILAAWLASGVPTVALLLTASALYQLGVVSELAWARTVSHALCALGVVPLACAVAYKLSDRPQGSPTQVAALIVLPALALEAFSAWSGPGDSSSAFQPFGPLLLVGVLTASLGLLLTHLWVKSPELEASPARGRHSSVARADAGRAKQGSVRAALRSSPFWFFLFHGRGHAVSAWLFLLIFLVVGSPAQMWFVGTWLWVLAYASSAHPSPLPAHLPISRQRLLGYLLAPLALFLVSGLARTHFGHPMHGSGFGVERYQDAPDRTDPAATEYRIVAPSFLWRASWGEPPLITTAEGVSRRPAAFALLPGLPLNVYNPYDARLDDDPAFVNHQASRILSREWHLDVSTADVERACHALQRGRMGLDCLKEQIQTKEGPPGAWLAVHGWLLCLIALATVQLQSSSASRPLALRLLSFPWHLLLIVVLPLAIDSVGKHDPTGFMNYPFRVSVLLGELTRLGERAPFATSAVALLLLLGFYHHTERAFVRKEAFAGVRRSAPRG